MKKSPGNLLKHLIFASIIAGCLKNASAEVIFRCHTFNKKEIILEEIENDVRYSYGKKK